MRANQIYITMKDEWQKNFKNVEFLKLHFNHASDPEFIEFCESDGGTIRIKIADIDYIRIEIGEEIYG